MNEVESYFKTQAEEIFMKANLCFQRGAFDEALVFYARTFEFNPNHQLALYNKAICKIQMKNFVSALSDLEYLIDNFEPTAEIYCSIAYTKDQLGDKFGALYDYNKAIDLKPDLLDANYNRGNLKFEFSDFESAIEDFTKTIELNSTYVNAYNNRGNCYFLLGELEKAVKDYDQTLELNLKHNQVYNNRGLCKAQLGDLDSALKDFERSGQIFLENNQMQEYDYMLNLIEQTKKAMQEQLNNSIVSSINKLGLAENLKE